MTARLLRTAGCLLAAASWAGAGLLAHITVVSPYTFNQHVLPILQQRCGACHDEGGVAPTSLLRYYDARLQTWPLRQVLISRRMPPWFADSGAAVLKEQQTLSAREIDVLMTWAAGGAPEGSAPPAPAALPAAVTAPPDLLIPMPTAFTLAAGTSEADYEITLPSERLRGKWIRAVDLRPGTPAIVRRAAIVLKRRGLEQVIGLWVPGDVPQMLEGNGAFHVRSGSSLVLRLHYQRPRPDDAGAISDRSQVGVYLGDRSIARDVRALDITSDPRPLTRSVRVVALHPVSGPVHARVTFVVVARDGSRTALMNLDLRPDWPRRYVFATPFPIEKGSRIETTLTARDGLLWEALMGDRQTMPDEGGKLRTTIQVID